MVNLNFTPFFAVASENTFTSELSDEKEEETHCERLKCVGERHTQKKRKEKENRLTTSGFAVTCFHRRILESIE